MKSFEKSIVGGNFDKSLINEFWEEEPVEGTDVVGFIPPQPEHGETVEVVFDPVQPGADETVFEWKTKLDDRVRSQHRQLEGRVVRHWDRKVQCHICKHIGAYNYELNTFECGHTLEQTIALYRDPLLKSIVNSQFGKFGRALKPATKEEKPLIIIDGVPYADAPRIPENSHAFLKSLDNITKVASED